MLLIAQPHPCVKQPTFSRIALPKKLYFPPQSRILVWMMPYGLKHLTKLVSETISTSFLGRDIRDLRSVTFFSSLFSIFPAHLNVFQIIHILEFATLFSFIFIFHFSFFIFIFHFLFLFSIFFVQFSSSNDSSLNFLLNLANSHETCPSNSERGVLPTPGTPIQQS